RLRDRPGVAACVGVAVAVGGAGRGPLRVGFGVAVGVAGGVAVGVAFGVGILRPENWILCTPVNWFALQNRSWLFPRISILPLPFLKKTLKKSLRLNWEEGLHNINELLKYSLQFILVIQCLNEELSQIPEEELIYRIAQIAAEPWDWNILKFCFVSLNDALQKEFWDNLWILPKSWRKVATRNLNTNLCFDVPYSSIAIGFWLLHNKTPDVASEAFKVVRNILYGEEMYVLAETLHRFTQSETPAQIAQTQLLDFPRENLLRPNTWQALDALRRVIEDTQLVQKSTSHTTRSLALNRSQGELKQILDTPENLPEAERELILDIARSWLDALLNIASEIGNIEINQPVTIPYIIGDPVEGKNFIGREDIMRELESYWIHAAKPHSVVLYGHRRMGKTSILRNVATCCGANLRVVYVNLQILGHVTQGIGEVLMSITDELAIAFNLQPPADNDLLTLPKRTFERYLKTIIPHLDNQNLIIALDEFEIVEELIEKGQIPPDFMGFLRGMVQLSPKIAFAFAGLHTLQEMTADYFQPFYASVIPLHVSFLNPAATRQILANPDRDFPLDYTGEALDRIHQLTHGQPYLVQWMGFSLVRRYNALVFEENRKLDPRFTVADVEAVIENPEFFQQGRYYFDGIWNQAKQDAPGQQEILQQLALHPEGLPRETLENALQFDEKMFVNAIEDLKRHDVVGETENGYKIIVELFRIWMVKHRRSRSLE
ncbi:MAG: AAA family ATPase, partial [Cyanobacteria bacterium SBLK]|nr:AAA family ATPase [Cyanobacteria bacterium SBLK]